MYKSSKCNFRFETPRKERLEFVTIGDTIACIVPSIDRVRTVERSTEESGSSGSESYGILFRVMPKLHGMFLYLRRSRNASMESPSLNIHSYIMQPIQLVDANAACDHHLPRAN